MRHKLIKEISDALKAMEQGEFQEFCLDFLPILNSDYKGLQRHGGTANGKTRKGTPDLIKTLSNGEQIAAQCSVATDYWNIPKDKNKFPKWKPCEDIDKCSQHLINIQDIVLCSSQEIPTSVPNAKAEILSYAKDKTEAKITLLSCVDIEDILTTNIGNPDFEALFKNYFHEIYEWIVTEIESQRNKLAIDIIKVKAIPFEDILKIATEATSNSSNFNDAKDYALKKIDELRSRFEREPLPEPGNIERHITQDFPLMKPIGIVQTLLGVPKIGKTSLVAQCAKNWKSVNINIHWFDSPIEEVEAKSLVEDISRNIWTSFLPPDKASELTAGIIRLQSISLDNLKYNLDYPTVYVLDNTEFLSKGALSSLCLVLAKLKSSGLLSYIGFVFISNKSLKYLCPAISNEFSAPPWTKAELKALLSNQLSGHDCHQNDKYLEILETMSAGHPLVALALARKFPSIEQLVFSKIKAPSLADEDLAAEIKKLLFQDILTDEDSLNYILRLSPLIFKANDKVIHAISRNINPVIAKPFKLILDKVIGTVIDGDERQGYSVSFVYKEVAKEKLTSKEQQEIHDIVSIELLKPEGDVLNAIEVTEGVFYALLAKNFERAFYWTIMLLQSAVNKDLPKIQLRTIIDRLEIITLVNQLDEPKLLAMYYSTLFSMAVAYVHIEDYKKAFEMLDKIKAPIMECKDREIKNHLITLIETAKIYKIVLIGEKEPVKSIKILSEIDFDKIKEFLPVNEIHIIYEIFKVLVSILPIKVIPKDILKMVINSADINNEKIIANLLSLGLNLGVKADLEKINLEEVKSFLPSSGPIAEILCVVVKSQYALQKEESFRALEFVQQAITLCRENSLLSHFVENILQQLQGDTYYKLHNDENAKKSYLRCLECLGDNVETFDYAWANHRLGLLSVDPTEAERYFRKSSSTFNLLGYEDLCARSEGERGVALVQLGRYLEFVRISEWMCRRYYLRRKNKFGPSVTVIMPQLMRLISNLENKPIQDSNGKICPKFERGVYTKVLDIANPQSGGLTAFYVLANGYTLLSNTKRKVKCLRAALSCEATNQLDRNSKPFVVRELLSEIIPNGSKNEIKDTILQGISIKSSEIRGTIELLSFCVFSAFDNILPELDNPQKKDFTALLSDIETTIENSKCENSIWWLAEIYLRKAKLAEGSLERKQNYYLWNKAYQYGSESSNYEVTWRAAHSVGFEYCEFAGSIKDLAEVQFNLIKAISLQNRNFERLETVGRNLFNSWKALNFSTLSEHDIKTKQTLVDGAKSIETAGFNPNNAAPLMILLLSSIYDYKGAVTDWAIEKAENIKSSIPKDIQEKIYFYFQQ